MTSTTRLPFVLWDLDGTLIDSARDITNAANAVRAEFGRPPLDEATLLTFVGEGSARLMQRVMGDDEPRSVQEKALRLFLERYGDALCVHTQPYPGIDAIVRRLEGRQAICTNKPGVFARRLVEHFGWNGLFREVIGGDEVRHRKPAPEMVDVVLERTGVARSEAIFVGDTSIDIDTARAAGLPMVCVSWGLRPRSEIDHAPLLVDTAEELWRAIERGAQ